MGPEVEGKFETFAELVPLAKEDAITGGTAMLPSMLIAAFQMAVWASCSGMVQISPCFIFNAMLDVHHRLIINVRCSQRCGRCVCPVRRGNCRPHKPSCKSSLHACLHQCCHVLGGPKLRLT